MISVKDRRLVETWAEHGVPRDQYTLDNLPIILAALVRSHDEAWRVVDDVLDHSCDCALGHLPDKAQTLFDGGGAA